MKRWNILADYDPSKDIVTLILKNRGIQTDADINTFLNPPVLTECFNDLSSELKKSLKNAKELIEEAVRSDLPIVIHGDYDADGISSTAILYNTIKNELKHEKTFYFIPNRFEHGYGISKKSVDEVIESITKQLGKVPGNILFVTVDSGITAVDETAYIKSLGHKIIITDHHQKPDTLPDADCIVWYDQVVGATLSWMLSKVLGSKDTQTICFAALATVTDLQQVVGFNRSIVKRGLEVLNTNPPIGLKKLMQVAGKKGDEVTTYDLGWLIGPRLNASGRLVDATDSLLLLLSKYEAAAEDLAFKLNKVNSERQDKTFEMYGLVANFEENKIPKIIFSAHTDYHEGIIGLVAARIVQKYYRPSVVISLSEDFGKGSVRSIPGVDIISYLRRFEDLFISLGGHPMAAGFTIKKENISVLETKMLELADELVRDDLLIPVLDIDLRIPINIISHEFLALVERLKPFGLGNEEPVFVSEGLGVAEVNLVGKESQHLSLKIYNEGSYYKAIYFNGASYANGLTYGDKIDLVYTVKKNEYNGKTYIDLVVKDLKKAE
jgi:single-stranded-DNA-specific exonuclease